MLLHRGRYGFNAPTREYATLGEPKDVTVSYRISLVRTALAQVVGQK